MKKIRIGFIGYGRRGPGMLRTLSKMPDVEIVAVCDVKSDKCAAAAKAVNAYNGSTPLCIADYRDFFKMDIDAVINCASWEDHVNVAVDCLNAGMPVGFEVGGAYNVEDCWEIVRAYERTHTPIMMLTNSRFFKKYMSLVRMAKEGLFGKIVHCEGGYCHYLTPGILVENYYRFENYSLRNSENYPCHAMGTIADLLDLNRGNKIVSLSSTASCSAGMHAYAAEHMPDSPVANVSFAQGDVVITTMKCARGETITLRLDTCLPRPYSRHVEIHGTKGIFMEDGNLVYLTDYPETCLESARELYNNADEFVNSHLHPAWEENKEIMVGDTAMSMDLGHGGTDFMVLRAFIDSLRNGWDMITDVYDAALFMAITPLSEESIIKGGAPVLVPDFTRGRYLRRKPITSEQNFWSVY